MEKELSFIVKLENTLGDLELEVREIIDSHEDIYSNEHIHMRDLLKILRETREQTKEICGKLILPDEFSL